MKIVYENGTGEIVEKKSRFIANVFDVHTEEEAGQIIADIRKKYWDARHNCYAYVIGDNNEVQKFSDDGEPSQTAGKPIMDIITKEGVHNCMIIVTRYFGGTLLGTGGLIRAYQGASKEGLLASTLVNSEEGIRASIDTDYNNVGKIQYICGQMDVDIVQTDYTENVHMEVLMSQDKYVHFVHRITDEFSGTLKVDKINDQKFCKIPGKGLIQL